MVMGKCISKSEKSQSWACCGTMVALLLLLLGIQNRSDDMGLLVSNMTGDDTKEEL